MFFEKTNQIFILWVGTMHAIFYVHIHWIFYSSNYDVNLSISAGMQYKSRFVEFYNRASLEI